MDILSGVWTNFIDFLPIALIAFGLLLWLADAMFAFLIPVLYKIPISVFSILLIFGGSYIKGREDAIKNLEQDKQLVKKIIYQQKVITNEVVKYYKEIDEVENEKFKTIMGEVTSKDNFMCVLPKSFVWLHNSAAKDTVPNPSERIDDVASDVDLSTAEKVIIENYEKYYKLSNQLKSLQNWVEQQKLNNP